jgi:hypothetical protein
LFGFACFRQRRAHGWFQADAARAREDNDAGRFKSVLSSVSGRRLTYKELIGNAPEATPS